MKSSNQGKAESKKMRQSKSAVQSPESKPELSLVVAQDPLSLREKTVAKLREAIVAGYFQPGERLVERDICAKTDVSRTSLREALRHLETEGVVESRKGEGVFVKALSPQDIRDIYELRMALDAETVQHFSERASAEDRIRLKAITDQWDKINYDDFDRVLAANNEFFSIIYEGAGNKLSQDIILSLQTRISLLRAITSRSSDKTRYLEGVALTREIVSEIEAGNARKAAKLARQFATRSMKFALAVVSGGPSEVADEPAPRSRRSMTA